MSERVTKEDIQEIRRHHKIAPESPEMFIYRFEYAGVTWEFRAINIPEGAEGPGVDMLQNTGSLEDGDHWSVNQVSGLPETELPEDPAEWGDFDSGKLDSSFETGGEMERAIAEHVNEQVEKRDTSETSDEGGNTET